MLSTNAPVKILDLTPVQLEEYMRLLGEPASHAGRLLKSVYRDCQTSFADMTKLSASLRRKLAQNATLRTIEPLEEKVSADARTRKALFRLEDGQTVESALMFYRNSNGGERRTVCVSSQVGCPVGCGFCATGLQGFERNLTPGEILGQVLFFTRRFREESSEPRRNGNRGWLTNVVFMGMGEPLANYENVRQAVAMLNSPKGMGLGTHQVTLSTSGFAPQIRRLIEEDLQFQLAVSLHAASDELRDRLVPINKKYPLDEVMAACREYAVRTGRKVFIEYALFEDVNDSLNHAEELISLLTGLSCSVNLILGNPTASTDFRPSSRETALVFQKKLIDSGLRAMLRVSRGADIEAGCGQLRSRWVGKQAQTRF